jgi:hypothetical protein
MFPQFPVSRASMFWIVPVKLICNHALKTLSDKTFSYGNTLREILTGRCYNILTDPFYKAQHKSIM